MSSCSTACKYWNSVSCVLGDEGSTCEDSRRVNSAGLCSADRVIWHVMVSPDVCEVARP